MKIGAIYSHLNGQEYLMVHKPALWKEIQHVITNVNAGIGFLKHSKTCLYV